MRIAAIEKLGFYATPPRTRELIADWLGLDGDFARALDPTAGDGGPLAYLADVLCPPGKTLETYGVEIQPDRAAEARECLDHVLATGWENTLVSPNAFSLLYLNPPYDWDPGEQPGPGNKNQRWEEVFLKSTVHKVMPGGVLVFLLPQTWLPTVGKRLAGYYSDLACRRLPDGEYEMFKQVVIFGRRRRKFAHDAELEATIRQWAQAGPALPTLEMDVQPYLIPAGDRKKAVKFMRNTLRNEELVELAAGVPGDELAQRLTPPSVEDISLVPATPFRTSHLAQLVTAGLAGTLSLNGKDGHDPYLAKGRVVKQFAVTGSQIEPTERGTRTRITEREMFSLTAYVLKANGDSEAMGGDAFARFLTQHAEEITRNITGRYPPRYQFEPTPEEMAVVNRLMKAVRLPGRRETGLFPAQKHMAIAGARSAAATGYFVNVAEMGYGKTATMTAQVELLHAMRGDAYPALVVAPSHLVDEWASQLPGILPGVNVVTIERTSERDERTGKKRSVPAVAKAVRFHLAHQAGLVPEKTIVLLSKETAKLGPGWKPAYHRQRVLRWSHDLDQGGKPKGLRASGMFVAACPTCGEIARDSEDLPLAFRVLDKKRHTCRHCGHALYEFRDYRRWPVADYIRRHMQRVFGVVIADEVHEFKAKDSIQGMALGSLVASSRYFLGGTGTIYGGTASSIFHLFCRMDGKLRRRFGFHGEKPFVEQYGRLEKVTTATEEETAYGLQTRHRVTTKEIPGANPRLVEIIASSCGFGSIADLGYELPPYAEEIIELEMTTKQELQYDYLDQALFHMLIDAVKTGDHGFASVYLQNLLCRPNSCFREEWVRRTVKLPGSEKRIKVDVLPEPLRPVVEEGEWLPKEKWLAEFVAKEAKQGRRTLIYLRQTATRDIQPRLLAALQEVGVKAQILPASVSARKRRGWFEKNAAQLDAVIVHPKKVATGLNLVAFSSVVFFEPDYSIYTMSQAMRRVWRPGQTEPVKVRFLVYAGTMEQRALALVAAKAVAAARVVGDDAEGALAAMNDDADGLMAELLNQAIKGTSYEDPRSILAAMAMQTNGDCLGVEAGDDPFAEVVDELLDTAPSVPAPVERVSTSILVDPTRAVQVGIAWFSAEQAAALKPDGNSKRRKKARAATKQLSLF